MLTSDNTVKTIRLKPQCEIFVPTKFRCKCNLLYLWHLLKSRFTAPQNCSHQFKRAVYPNYKHFYKTFEFNFPRFTTQTLTTSLYCQPNPFLTLKTRILVLSVKLRGTDWEICPLSFLPDTGSAQVSLSIHRAGPGPSSASTQEEEIARLSRGSQEWNDNGSSICHYSNDI